MIKKNIFTSQIPYSFNRTWKMRLGNPFRGMDNLFIYWLQNKFGTHSCFDRRFLTNHVWDINEETKLNEPKFTYSLHPIDGYVDGKSIGLLFPDLQITAITGARFGLRRWMIGFHKAAFNFDPLEAITDNLMQAKMSAPIEIAPSICFEVDGGRIG